ncbi:pyridoxamine 5'-phosphate oxidase family protein [Paraburkholderia silviterrae]|uniref:Pyridoxamine 5'-phosphate oxidase n=1 Tax=Paraburkholderia silviterrae TaxID=2528715 RepID=A0A4R5M0B4_9BURK|nr:pyridoxamine 5'-phosphate oxidase family protein [Paraburkholderia silviterrae]TDG18514.1 pyridoxamine 5'-phosphate oxidase [Paraburkholderia silviterrae]
MRDVIDRVWSMLSAGANAAATRSPFTMLQAATVGLDGGPKVRTIVLRGVSPEAGSLIFHTDVRSEKVLELGKDPRISLLGCDLDAGIQIRLEGVARMVDSLEERMALWKLSRPHSLIVYRAQLAPGTPIASPEEAHTAPGNTPDSMAGFENFCLVTVDVQKIDYLDLSPNRHARAKFCRQDGAWHGGWVTP